MRTDPGRTFMRRRLEIETERGRNQLRVIFPNHPLAVRDALKSTLDGLRHLDLSEDEASTIELVLAEVMNNVVEHAFPDEREGIIELHMAYATDGLDCTVKDNGLAMPNGNPPVTCPPDPGLSLDLLAEGGFGWFLIRELASDLGYAHDGTHNVLTFHLDVGRNVRTS